MTSIPDGRDAVIGCLHRFLESIGRRGIQLHDRLNVMRDLDLSSDEGVDFVLDLCEEFSFEFPADFNPFVHENGRRGRKIGEMVSAVLAFMQVQEAAK